MRSDTCFFVGHKKMAKVDLERLLIELNNEIDNLIMNGVKDFICGGQTGFDLLVASFIVVKKEQGKDVRLIFNLPYNGYERHWTDEEKKLQSDLLSEADEVMHVCGSNSFDCVKKQYEYMAGKSDYCIYSSYGKKGEMVKYIENDKNEKLTIINIGK